MSGDSDSDFDSECETDYWDNDLASSNSDPITLRDGDMLATECNRDVEHIIEYFAFTEGLQLSSLRLHLGAGDCLLASLCQTVAAHKPLQLLKISGPRAPEASKDLAEALKHNKTLLHLDLTGTIFATV